VAKTGSELRRAVTTWGSYAWGYADVGADIYVALGAVVGIAAGASNIAFGFAGLVYVCIGLAYTELAAAYPIAGGGQFFVTRALGDFMGFVAGWAVLLDFTIDISLFAWFTIGYVSSPKLIPWLASPEHHIYYFICVLAVAGFLTYINVIGVKQSSRVNEVVADRARPYAEIKLIEGLTRRKAPRERGRIAHQSLQGRRQVRVPLRLRPVQRARETPKIGKQRRNVFRDRHWISLAGRPSVPRSCSALSSPPLGVRLANSRVHINTGKYLVRACLQL